MSNIGLFNRVSFGVRRMQRKSREQDGDTPDTQTFDAYEQQRYIFKDAIVLMLIGIILVIISALITRLV